MLRRHQNRRDEGGGDAEPRQRRAMQQRRGERAERHQPEQDEGGGGREKIVQRVGGIDGREGDRGAGGGEDRRDIGDRQRRDGRDALLAARPFAGRQQRQRERAAEQGAHAGPEQPGLDRVADHEEAAERQRQAADPDHPAGADALLEAGRGLRKRRRHRGRAACGLPRGGSIFAAGGIGLAAVDGRLLGRDRRAMRSPALFELLQRRSAAAYRPRLPCRRFDRIEPRAQRRGLIERLAREDERDDGNQRAKRNRTANRTSSLQAIGPASRA